MREISNRNSDCELKKENKMYICEDCGNTEEELTTTNNPVWIEGRLVHDEKIVDRCRCGGDYVKAKKCSECEEWFAELNGYGKDKICDSCLERHINFETAIAYGEETEEEIEINGYLANQFTAYQINAILERELREYVMLGGKTCDRQYCLEDKDHFADWVAKEGEMIK